jgi:heme/copper-type cytochrome/quinol oxidase subunit 2
MNGTRNRALLMFGIAFGGWLALFSAMYAMQATGCEWGWDRIGIGPLSLLRLTLFGMLATGVIGLIVLLAMVHRRRPSLGAERLDTFLWRANVTLAIAAIVATVWIGLALAVPTMCGS